MTRSFLRVGLALTLAATSTAQLGWRLMTPTSSPPARVQSAVSFDGQGVVLFGGVFWTSQGSFFNDTWRWDGSDWSDLRPATAPSPRAGSAMAYDSVRQRILLFGGDRDSLYLNDTWEWDGRTWSQLSPSSRPPAFQRPRMAFDPVRQRMILVGTTQRFGSSTVMHTWEWDGVNWSQASSSLRAVDYALAFDVVLNRMTAFLIHREFSGSTYSSETWAYVSGTWLQYGPAMLPPPRHDPAVALDEARARITMFGGSTKSGSSGFLSDTWEWDGGGWQQLALGNAPGPRGGPTMAYDPLRRRLVMFGGYGTSGILGDTWELANPNLGDFSPFGAGCAGAAGTPVLDAVPPRSIPRIGEGFGLRITSLPVDRPTFLYLGFSRAMWHGVALPLDLAPLGAPGCSLLVGPDLVLPLWNLGGVAPVTLSIPNDQGLVGIRFFVQGWAADPTANQLGIVVSNGGQGLIGHP